MRNTHFVIASLVASFACACSADVTEAGGQEALSTVEEALSTTGFDLAAQELFVELANVQWADAHFSINGGPQRNVRLVQDGARLVVGPLPVVAGDQVTYSFTYSVDGRATDTAAVTETLAADYIPAAFRGEVQPSGSAYAIRAVASEALSWADVHYSVNGGAQQNLRMAQGTGALETLVNLGANDTLTYWFTYSKNGFVFDSAPAVYKPHTLIVVDNAMDASYGVSCATDGSANGLCNLREALEVAQTLPGEVEILLTVSTHVGLNSMWFNTTTPEEVVVRGATGEEIISGYGVFLSTAAGSAPLTLADLHVSGFNTYSGTGAISNAGNLTLDGAVVENNNVSCSGSGAMTAYAYCSTGALYNAGTLTLRGGTRFEGNSVTAGAWSAAYVNATAAAGAIYNTGTINIDGAVTFARNVVRATASAGWHPYPIGGASASASGGAIFNSSGSVNVVQQGVGQCVFDSNEAQASGSSEYGSSAAGVGGAIWSSGGLLNIPAGACTFSGNLASTDPDIHAE